MSNPHAQEPIGTAQQLYDGALPPDLLVNTCRNIDRFFPVRRIDHNPDAIQPLPGTPAALTNFEFESEGKQWDLFDYLSLGCVTGLLVLQNGQVRAESYYHGNTPRTRWMSMSVAKSVSAMLVGVAIQDGKIASVDDPLTRYLPQFAETAYDGVSVRQLLQMTSGVGWNETYTDATSDRRLMLQAQLEQKPGAILELMAGLPRVADPGTVWNYSTGETHLVGALLAAATGRHVAHYLSEKIWIPMGMESEATWWLEAEDGLEVGGSGIAATLRDYARFGLFMLHDGFIDDQQLLPNQWMTQAGSPKQVAGETVDYGYMLWPQPHGAYTAAGIFGQFVYVRPDKNLVIALLSARPKPQLPCAIEPFDFLTALAESI